MEPTEDKELIEEDRKRQALAAQTLVKTLAEHPGSEMKHLVPEFPRMARDRPVNLVRLRPAPKDWKPFTLEKMWSSKCGFMQPGAYGSLQVGESTENIDLVVTDQFPDPYTPRYVYLEPLPGSALINSVQIVCPATQPPSYTKPIEREDMEGRSCYCLHSVHFFSTLTHDGQTLFLRLRIRHVGQLPQRHRKRSAKFAVFFACCGHQKRPQ